MSKFLLLFILLFLIRSEGFGLDRVFPITSDAQRSSVWRSVAKASAERPDFAERERALERLTPER